MKDEKSKLKQISENIGRIIDESSPDLTPKELSEKANMSYSTLAPILRGDRDFRISNLLGIAEALNVSPNDLLDGLYQKQGRKQTNKSDTTPPRYLISFVTDVGLTHCRIVDLQTKSIINKILQFSLFCTTEPSQFINQIKGSIRQMLGDIDMKEAYLYISVLAYEHLEGRHRIVAALNKEFGTYIVEPDWMPVHKSLLANKNGILLTINNGYAISYSDDNGKTIKKVQGYSFPISDEAGNFWLGCEAIKHAINVQEGVDPPSMLSNKVLSLVNSDLELLATKAYDQRNDFFVQIASIVKELANKKDMAYEIIRKGFNNIWERIKQVDKKLGQELPVYLSGDLAYLYEEFIPKKRLIQQTLENIIDTELNYTIEKLKELVKAKCGKST